VNAYNAAIPGIVAQKGALTHLVDMHSAITTADLADGVHPNATGYDKMARIKMRTGGSIGNVSRRLCQKLTEQDGVWWDLSNKEKESEYRLPVKYRYRAPIIFEFHTAGQRKSQAYAVIWLQHFIDNEDTPINIPIWTTRNASRLTQNYITERNCKDEVALDDLKEVGRLQFRGRFKAGMDESHGRFVQDNDSRETYETWEACQAEGVRQRIVEKEVPERVQQLHEQSLQDGRDVLKERPAKERKRWVSKDGTDWSGAFGHDPMAYATDDGKKLREPGAQPPARDPHHPELDKEFVNGGELPSSDEDSEAEDSSSEPDLGIMDGDNTESAANMDGGKKSTSTDRTGASGSSGSVNAQNKRTEQRKHRGLMQWKPARNAKFAKDEGKLGLRKLKNRITGGLDGRQPGVETEIGQ